MGHSCATTEYSTRTYRTDNSTHTTTDCRRLCCVLTFCFGPLLAFSCLYAQSAPKQPMSPSPISQLCFGSQTVSDHRCLSAEAPRQPVLPAQPAAAAYHGNLLTCTDLIDDFHALDPCCADRRLYSSPCSQQGAVQV